MSSPSITVTSWRLHRLYPPHSPHASRARPEWGTPSQPMQLRDSAAHMSGQNTSLGSLKQRGACAGQHPAVRVSRFVSHTRRNDGERLERLKVRIQPSSSPLLRAYMLFTQPQAPPRRIHMANLACAAATRCIYRQACGRYRANRRQLTAGVDLPVVSVTKAAAIVSFATVDNTVAPPAGRVVPSANAAGIEHEPREGRLVAS